VGCSYSRIASLSGWRSPGIRSHISPTSSIAPAVGCAQRALGSSDWLGTLVADGVRGAPADTEFKRAKGFAIVRAAAGCHSNG